MYNQARYLDSQRLRSKGMDRSGFGFCEADGEIVISLFIEACSLDAIFVCRKDILRFPSGWYTEIKVHPRPPLFCIRAI